MSLKDRINKIQKYFRAIEYQGGLLIVKVQFPAKIVPTCSTDDIIKVAKDDNNDDLWYYYADADLVDEDAIFDLIENTVKVYEEAKAKVVLMKQKIEELRELFANNSLDKLNTLYFDFNAPTSDDATKVKRKYVRKKKVQENENNEEIKESE